MISTLLIWIIAFTNTYFISKIFHFKIDPNNILIDLFLKAILSFFCIIIYATVYNFWFPINIYFQILLFFSGLIVAKFNKNEILSEINLVKKYANLSTFKQLMPALIILSIIVAKSSREVRNGDSFGYHIPCIRMAEQFPLIKGIANLDIKLGYSSIWFVGQAIYSYSYSSPTHLMNGFLLLLLTVFLFLKYKATKDLLYLVSPLFLLIAPNMISGPTPDGPINILVVFCSILAYDYLKNNNLNIKQKRGLFSVLTFLLFCLVSIKLSGLFLLILLPFIIILEKFQDFKFKISMITLIMAIVLVPLSFRNFIMTGYFFFPIEHSNIFKNIMWEVDVNKVINENIVLWTANTGWTDETKNIPILEKMIIYLNHLRRINILNPILLFTFILSPIQLLIDWNSSNKPRKFISLAVFISGMIGLILVPSPRFILGSILFLLATGIIVFFEKYKLNPKAKHLIYIILIFQLPMGYIDKKNKYIFVKNEIIESSAWESIIYKNPYPIIKYKTQEINGLELNVPIKNNSNPQGFSVYTTQPSSRFMDFKLLKTNFEEGLTHN